MGKCFFNFVLQILKDRVGGSVNQVIKKKGPRCCFRAPLHFVRSAARPSQDIIVLMWTGFICLTQTLSHNYCMITQMEYSHTYPSTLWGEKMTCLGHFTSSHIDAR